MAKIYFFLQFVVVAKLRAILGRVRVDPEVVVVDDLVRRQTLVFVLVAHVDQMLRFVDRDFSVVRRKLNSYFTPAVKVTN